MRKKPNRAYVNLTRLGGPEAGSVTALAISPDAERGATMFAGTHVGLFRLVPAQDSAAREWKRLDNGPLGILSLGVSPCFADDKILVAGTNAGIFVSHDAGETWLAAEMPIAGSAAIAIAFSPNYRADGILLAGTLEDGILYSDNRGTRWQSNGFGLLDATVYCLAFSPDFAHDTTVFAGTDTTVYFTYNGALAWKQLDFPEGATPALSLAISPNFETDHTLYLGTEQQSLYRSVDRGRSWLRLSLPAQCVNALVFSEPQHTLLAATEAGVFSSSDQGETWGCLLDLPNMISLAAAGELTVAGAVDQGVWLVTHPAEWQPIPKLSARAVLGLALSPQFDQQPVAFMYGPREGIWRTADGGHTWVDLGAELPNLDISALALSPNYSTNQVAVAATPEGVAISTDGGDHWARVGDFPASLVAFSPNGKLLVAGLPTGGIQLTEDLGQHWVQVPGPWDAGTKVSALAVSDSRHYRVAGVQRAGGRLSIWQGEAGQADKMVNQAVGENPVVAFYVPADFAPEPTWYAGCGNRVWKFSTRKGQPAAQSAVFPDVGSGESILSLTGIQDEGGQTLLAGTGSHVYKLDAKGWRKVHDFVAERAIALVLSPTYLQDETVFVLVLGGSFCRCVIH